MKIRALGVNGAFTKNYHNNYVFEFGGRKLLVDAGTTLRKSLPSAGYKESDITDIIITHLHSDHVGGLEEFAQRCKWIHNHKPNLLIRQSMKKQLEEVIGRGLFTEGLTLEDYFNLPDIYHTKRGYRMFEHYSFEFTKTDNLHVKGMKSMGFKISDPYNSNIIFTSDIAKHEEAEFKAMIDNNTVALFHDVSITPNNVHSNLKDVIEFYKDGIDLDKIYGMHYQDDVDIYDLSVESGINFVITDKVYEFLV